MQNNTSQYFPILPTGMGSINTSREVPIPNKKSKDQDIQMMMKNLKN